MTTTQLTVFLVTTIHSKVNLFQLHVVIMLPSSKDPSPT